MQTLSQILTPGCTLCRAPASSQKRLFQLIAGLVSKDRLFLQESDVFNRLLAREKLGSTALGSGIAIPHCRIERCTDALGSLITLEEPLDFGAPDGRPVDLVFALLVPEDANQQHLDLLAGLARLFQQSAFCDALRRSVDAGELFRVATTWED
jgi:PTS system nitrogen regulatory IIA component